MTRQLLIMILLWCTCANLVLAQQPTPAKNCGPNVTLSACTYLTIKAKIEAADRLRSESQKAIDGLKAERDALQTQVDQLGEVSEHDLVQLADLNRQLGEVADQLSTYERQYEQATAVLEQIRALLPARKRRQATTPQLLAQLVGEQLEAGQKAPVKWGGIGVALGFILSLVL